MDHDVNRSIVYSTIYLGLVFTTAARIPYNPLYPLTPAAIAANLGKLAGH